MHTTARPAPAGRQAVDSLAPLRTAARVPFGTPARAAASGANALNAPFQTLNARNEAFKAFKAFGVEGA